MPKLTFTAEQIAAISTAIENMAVLWNEHMSEARLAQFIYTLTVQNTTMSHDKILHSIALARMQDSRFPMPSDILQRPIR